jgi:hypothetical protein
MSPSVLAAVPLVVALLAAPSRAVAQGEHATPAGSAEPARINPDRLPIDIEKIQRAVARRPAIRLSSDRQVFRVEVFGRSPTIEDILGPDYLVGPVPYGGMSHQDFLNMVTPKDVQGYAAFTNKEGLMVAATSMALQWGLRQAIAKYNDAKEARAREAARKEVEAALAALRKARREAGLPDK